MSCPAAAYHIWIDQGVVGQDPRPAVCDDCGATCEVALTGAPVLIRGGSNCTNCGWGTFTLYTTCPQDGATEDGQLDEANWYAYEGELAICADCGALHEVSVDDRAWLREWGS